MNDIIYMYSAVVGVVWYSLLVGKQVIHSLFAPGPVHSQERIGQ